jgi:hypothetical protein
VQAEARDDHPAIRTGALNARYQTIQLAAINPARWPGPASGVKMR